MTTSNLSETFESKPFFDKVTPWARGVVAGLFLGAGMSSVAVEVDDIASASNYAVCDRADNKECQAYLSDQRDDIPGSLGGLAVGSMLAGSTLYITRREEHKN